MLFLVVVDCVLFVVRRVHCFVCCCFLLFGVCWVSLFAVCCGLFVVVACCVMFVNCSLLAVGDCGLSF